jgi:hypothetical protein
MIRALRLELIKPLDEQWETAGPLLRTLSKVTPKLLNAALDAKIAIGLVGRDPVKAKIAPDAKASSSDGLAYQAVLRAVENLREWGEKKTIENAEKAAEKAAKAEKAKKGSVSVPSEDSEEVDETPRAHPYATLEVPSSMAAAIGRVASQAYGRRDQEAPRFSSERILLRASETSVTKDIKGIALSLKLRAVGKVRFAVAHSWGAHRETLDAIVSGEIPHGDCKIQWDERRKKWYALISYEAPEPAPVSIDPARALAVHRGIRNALYLLPATGARGIPLPGSKFLAQRRGLQARTSNIKHTSAAERGSGAKGHGRSRRYETYDALGDKIARVTHTFCQQAASFVAETAKRMGCGLVIIEDYGGIEPDEDPHKRRLLDKFPLYEMKQAIAHRLERDGLTLREADSHYISSVCPRCENKDTRQHNTRTGMFHCGACLFERPADWVASYWLLFHGGADMTVWKYKLRREKELSDALNSRKEALA